MTTPNRERDAAIILAFKSGEPVSVIASRHDRSRSRVWQIIEKNRRSDLDHQVLVEEPIEE